MNSILNTPIQLTQEFWTINFASLLLLLYSFIRFIPWVFPKIKLYLVKKLFGQFTKSGLDLAQLARPVHSAREAGVNSFPESFPLLTLSHSSFPFSSCCRLPPCQSIPMVAGHLQRPCRLVMRLCYYLDALLRPLATTSPPCWTPPLNLAVWSYSGQPWSIPVPLFALWGWISSDLHHLTTRFAWHLPWWLPRTLPVARVSFCWCRPAPALLRSALGGGTSVMVASAYSCWRGPVRVVRWRPRAATALESSMLPTGIRRPVDGSPLLGLAAVLRSFGITPTPLSSSILFSASLTLRLLMESWTPTDFLLI
jgi:hypothetical protein